MVLPTTTPAPKPKSPSIGTGGKLGKAAFPDRVVVTKAQMVKLTKAFKALGYVIDEGEFNRNVSRNISPMLNKAKDIQDPMQIAIKVFTENYLPKLQNPSQQFAGSPVQLEQTKEFLKDWGERFGYGDPDIWDEQQTVEDLDRKARQFSAKYDYKRMINAIAQGIIKKDRAKEWNKVVGEPTEQSLGEADAIGSAVMNAADQDTNFDDDSNLQGLLVERSLRTQIIKVIS